MDNNNNNNVEFERLVKLETKFEILTNTLTNAIERLEKKLDYREESFVKKEVLEETLKFYDQKVDGLQQAIITIREENKNKKMSLPGWIQSFASIVAIGISVVAILNQ